MLIAANNNALSSRPSAARSAARRTAAAEESSLPATSSTRELSDIVDPAQGYLPAEIAQGTTPERYAEIVEGMVKAYHSVKRTVSDLSIPDDTRRIALDFGILTPEEIKDYDDSRDRLYGLCHLKPEAPTIMGFNGFLLGLMSGGWAAGPIGSLVGGLLGGIACYWGEKEQTRQAIAQRIIEIPGATARYRFHLNHIKHQLEDRPIDPDHFKPGHIPSLEKKYEGRLGEMINSLSDTKARFEAASTELAHARIEPYGLKIVMMRGEL